MLEPSWLTHTGHPLTTPLPTVVRAGEVQGVHYNFTSKDAMSSAIDEGKFLEYAQVHANLYGTSLDAVRKVQRAGKICVLVSLARTGTRASET